MTYEKSPFHHGYTNRILRIDVGTGAVSTPELDSEARDYFIGGRGLGLYLLHTMTKPETVASAPENPLILANGPLCGVPQFPGAAKAMAVSLSPLTGIPGVSNFGGYFPSYLKYAGFDALVITGRAERESMIVIDGFKREIRIEEAPDLNEVFLLERAIAERFEKEGYQKRNIAFMTTAIGSENTTYGCINSHYFDVTKPTAEGRGIFRTKQAGRTGMGSVMAGKKVKAIVLLADHPQGENPLGAADWDRVKRAGTTLRKVISEVDPHSLKMYRKGSAGLITFMNKGDYRSLPVNNFQGGSDPRAPQICGKFYDENLFEHRGMDGCFAGCNLRCTKGGWVTLSSGSRKGEKVWVDGPEYETAAGFGSNLGIYNPEFIWEANWHCDNYALDIISLATLMAFVMECFQRGYLTRDDAEGLELTWGDEASALEFMHRVAYGRTALARAAGISMTALKNWVAERYEKRTGRDALPELELFAMQTKELPFSFYRTHRSVSMQASYAAASDIGAHHAAAWLIKVDLLGAFPTFEDKARALVMYPRVRLGNDNLGLCKLPWVDVVNPESLKAENFYMHINSASQELYADFFNGMIGTEMTWEEIFEQTDRDINLQRVMNVMKFGRDAVNYDWVPDRAIGPTDDQLYLLEGEYNDAEVAKILSKQVDELLSIPVAERRELLMSHRKQELRRLIHTYYQKRGWSEQGIPTVETLKRLGLWSFLNGETRGRMVELAG
jgi:aldehyde:ferredoxin oxidoreductase